MKNIKSFLYLIVIVLISCNKNDEIIGTNISDLLWLENKGAQMQILVEGNTASKTFILILHGGPGGNSAVYNEEHLAMSEALEEKYAVAYWDQRLSGISKGQLSDDEMSLDLMIEDTDKVIELLKYRYGSDINIFLLGHSWGGYLGNAYLAQGDEYQQKIKGWIDVAGAHNTQKRIRDGLTLMRAIAEERIADNSDRKTDWENVLNYVQGVDSLSGIDVDFSLEVNREAWKAMTLAVEDGLYTVREITGRLFGNNNVLKRFNTGQMLVNSGIDDEMLVRPLTDELVKIKTPALLMWGKYDLVVPPSLGEEMLNNLGTPSNDKTLHIFEDTGHAPMFSETDKFLDLVFDFVEAYK